MKVLTMITIALFASTTLSVHATNMPPRNSYLADSSYAIAHGDSAQQDSVAQQGPAGRRVFWGNGIDRIVKIDHDTYEVLDEYFFPGATRYDEAQADASITEFDASNDGIFAIYRAYQEMSKLQDLANLYTVLDKDHTYFVGSKTGLITAYADADPEDSRSAIVKRDEFQLPTHMTGPVMGLNMTYDGWLVVATEHGYIGAIKRDFSEFREIRLLHSDGAEEKATGPTGKGWVRNGFATNRVVSISPPRTTCTKWYGTATH